MPQSTSICIDASHFNASNPTGVEWYVQELIPPLTEKLQAMGATVSWIGHTVDSPLQMPRGTFWLHSPYRKLWSQTGLPRLLAQVDPKLFFTPSGIPPLRTQCLTAMTVHDLASYRDPSAYSVGQRLRLQWLSCQAARRASKIIVPSQYTATEIEHFWKISEEQVAVIPEGFTVNEQVPEVVARLVDTSYFLYVGRLERKKNLIPLIQGFVRLAAEKDIRLVLAGGQGFGYAEIKREITDLPESTQEKIIELGYVSDAQKVWLYAHALAGVIPCPYEGFGLPILDCFAANVTALCAKAGALPEVGGDACLYVEWTSPTDWYLQMQTIFNEPSLLNALTRKGAEYLKVYNWDQAAKLTSETLLKI